MPVIPIYDRPTDIVSIPIDWISYGDSRDQTTIPAEFNGKFTNLLIELQTITGKTYTLKFEEPGKKSLEIYPISQRGCQCKVISKYQNVFNGKFTYEELNGTYNSLTEIRNQIDRFLLRDFLETNDCEITEGENKIYWKCPECKAYGVKYNHSRSYNILQQHSCVYCEKKCKSYMSHWNHLKVNDDELTITSAGVLIATIELI